MQIYSFQTDDEATQFKTNVSNKFISFYYTKTGDKFEVSQEKIDSLPLRVTFFGIIDNGSDEFAILGFTYLTRNWSAYLLMHYNFTLYYTVKQNGVWQTPYQIK